MAITLDMKKMLSVIAMFMIFFTGGECDNISLADYFDGECIVYTDSDNTLDSVDLGFCFMSSSNAKGEVFGESIKVECIEIAAAIEVLGASLKKVEVLDDSTIVLYCYTDKIATHVIVDGESVNIQIAQKAECTIIGWPLILGSY